MELIFCLLHLIQQPKTEVPQWGNSKNNIFTFFVVSYIIGQVQWRIVFNSNIQFEILFQIGHCKAGQQLTDFLNRLFYIRLFYTDLTAKIHVYQQIVKYTRLGIRELSQIVYHYLVGVEGYFGWQPFPQVTHVIFECKFKRNFVKEQ